MLQLKVMRKYRTENKDTEWKMIQRLNQISTDLLMTVMLTHNNKQH